MQALLIRRVCSFAKCGIEYNVGHNCRISQQSLLSYRNLQDTLHNSRLFSYVRSATVKMASVFQKYLNFQNRCA